MARCAIFGVISMRSQLVLALRRRLFKIVGPLVRTTAHIMLISFSIASPAGATSDQNVQDFRELPLTYLEALKEPLVDEKYIRERLSRLVLPLDPDQGLRGIGHSGFLRRSAKLTYHVTTRVEDPNAVDGFRDIHLPSSSSQQTPPRDEPYISIVGEIEKTMRAFALQNDIAPEADPQKSDIRIRISLSERAQTSKGFVFAPHSGVNRTSEPAIDERHNAFTYALPWAFVRVSLADASYDRMPDGGVRSRREIQGADIWIQYPVRIYWQENLARHLLDDQSFAMAMGMEGGREALVEKFRAPDSLSLEPLSTAQQQPRLRWPMPRPAETLLTAASGVFQPSEIVPQGAGGGCSKKEHASIISGRLTRAVSLVVSGVRGGGLLVEPSGDYTAQFRENPNGLLASLSLGSYEDLYDQQVDDRLAGLLASVAHDGKVGSPAVETILTNRRAELVDALREVAVNLRTGGDLCTSKVNFKTRLNLE